MKSFGRAEQSNAYFRGCLHALNPKPMLSKFTFACAVALRGLGADLIDCHWQLLASFSGVLKHLLAGVPIKRQQSCFSQLCGLLQSDLQSPACAKQMYEKCCPE